MSHFSLRYYLRFAHVYLLFAPMSNKVSVLESGKKAFPYYVSYPDGGKRVKKYFKRKQREGGADEWAIQKRKELAEEGSKHAAVNELEMQAVIRFRAVVDALPGHAKDVTLNDAVEVFAKSLESRNKSISCKVVAGKLMSKLKAEGRSESHITNTENRLDRFNKDYGDWLACDVSTEIIDDFLDGLEVQSQTIIHYRRVVSQLFKRAVSLKAAPSNPVDDAINPKVVSAPTEVLGPKDVAALLSKADDSVLPALAISFFAGVRIAEIKRLDWAEIDLKEDEIEIKAANAKSAQRRHIPISKNLKAWLLPYVQLSGSVVKNEYALRKGTLAAREKAKIKKWPHNAGRHSFASYHLAHHANREQLVNALGHASSEIVFKHYRKLVRSKDAATYWSITPDAAENITNIKSA